MTRKTYSSRSSAIAAAKNAIKKIQGSFYQAAEGADFYIHPQMAICDLKYTYTFELTSLHS